MPQGNAPSNVAYAHILVTESNHFMTPDTSRGVVVEDDPATGGVEAARGVAVEGLRATCGVEAARGVA